MLYERGDQEVVGFTLSPAAAKEFFLFAGAIKPLPPGEAAPQASERVINAKKHSELSVEVAGNRCV